MPRLLRQVLLVLVGALLLFGVDRLLNLQRSDGQPAFNPFWLRILLLSGIYVTLAVSLNIVNGFTGQFSIGHAGFMAVGAYVGAAVTYKLPGLQNSLGLLLSCLVGGGVAALFGWLVGVPSLRLRGDYLAIVTLGFGEIIRVLLENTDKIPGLEFLGGAVGFNDIPKLTNFFWVFGLAALTITLARNLKRSLHGLAFQSVREDEIAADAMGVNTTKVKVTAFVLASFLAGAAGSLYAHNETFILPKSFNFILSINLIVMIVLGGLGSITGATITAIFFTALPEFLRAANSGPIAQYYKDEYRLVAFALLLALTMLLRPQGLFGRGELTLFRRRKMAPFPAKTPPQPSPCEGEGASRRSPSPSLGEGDSMRPSASSQGEGVPSGSPPPYEGESYQTAPPPYEGGGRGEVLTEEPLRCEGVTKRFGGLTAVGDFNIRLRCGELVGLIGPNGAGKTTAFNLLTGVYEPTSGAVLFDGKLIAGERPYPPNVRAALLAWDTVLAALGGFLIGTVVFSSVTPLSIGPSELLKVFPLAAHSGIAWGCVLIAMALALGTAPRRRRNRPGLKPYACCRLGIARTFQNIRLFANLTVLENVLVSAYGRRRSNLFSAMLQTEGTEQEEQEARARARTLLREFGLDQEEGEQAKNLPYGDQRRLEIVRALMTRPKLLLLDEPAAGMNPQEKGELMGLIRQVRDEFGLTILLIEHDMKLVMGICERIYVLDYGRIIAEGTPEEIRRNPKVIAAYLGEELGDADGDGVPDGEQQVKPAAGKRE
ncbi:MAG TPA: ATP-binding cassette domain-containing protein [Chthonomonadaceae bacterium]|nr:ATP-binding cassette domain-containing protein [Chthonomonadaceae bacterium]